MVCLFLLLLVLNLATIWTFFVIVFAVFLFLTLRRLVVLLIILVVIKSKLLQAQLANSLIHHHSVVVVLLSHKGTFITVYLDLEFAIVAIVIAFIWQPLLVLTEAIVLNIEVI